jgi:hypothetical protein
VAVDHTLRSLRLFLRLQRLASVRKVLAGFELEGFASQGCPRAT